MGELDCLYLSLFKKMMAFYFGPFSVASKHLRGIKKLSAWLATVRNRSPLALLI